MAGFYEYFSIDKIIGDECDVIKTNLLTHILFPLDFFPYIIIGSNLFSTFWCWDIFFISITCIVWIDLSINFILTHIIKQYSPIGSNCIYSYQMPSYAAQLLAIYLTLFVLLMLKRKSKVSIKATLWVIFFSYAILFQRVYRKVNTPNQLIAGSFIGFVNGVIGFLFVYYVIQPNSAYVESLRIMKYLDIKNTFFLTDNYEIRLLKHDKERLAFLLIFIMKIGGFETLQSIQNFFNGITIKQFEKIKKHKKYDILYENMKKKNTFIEKNEENEINYTLFEFPTKVLIT